MYEPLDRSGLDWYCKMLEVEPLQDGGPWFPFLLHILYEQKKEIDELRAILEDDQS